MYTIPVYLHLRHWLLQGALTRENSVDVSNTIHVAFSRGAGSGDYGISLTSSVTSFEVEFFVRSDFYRSELIASSPSVKEELAHVSTLRVEVQSQRVT